VEILFVTTTLNNLVMLRNEASATDETDASFLSMTEVTKKIGTKSGTEITKMNRICFSK